MKRCVPGVAVVVAAPVALGAPPAYHTAVAAAGPLVWYQFNEAAGNVLNYGSSGAAFDATCVGSIGRSQATYAGDTGVLLNSPDDIIQSLGSSTLTGNPTFTIETIINLTGSAQAAAWGPFLQWGDGGGSTGGPQRNGKEVYFSISGNANNRIFAGFYNAGPRTVLTVPTDAWIHVVWVRPGANNSMAGTTLYINGQTVALEQDPGLTPGFLAASAIDVTSTPYRIHEGADNIGTRRWIGGMDELAVYNRALSAAEVQALFNASGLASCYANCDHSTASPVLNVNDFICFQTHFAAGDVYANCDGSTATPILNVNDFVCFQTRFAAGCL